MFLAMPLSLLLLQLLIDRVTFEYDGRSARVRIKFKPETMERKRKKVSRRVQGEEKSGPAPLTGVFRRCFGG